MAESTNRLTLRVGRSTLCMLAQGSGNNDIDYEPYVVKSGVSMAANLRDAFKKSRLLQQVSPRVHVLIDSDVLLVPVEQFEEDTMADMHRHAFPGSGSDVVLYNVLPALNAVAVFAVNKDLRMVLDDHFSDVTMVTLMQPVWRHLHQRSFTGSRQKLYAYFHEKRLELCAFQQNRFKFCNSFEAPRYKDAVFFITYVWQQLNMAADTDELHLVGDMAEQEAMVNELKLFLQNVYVINASADFSQHPAAQLKGVPYDLLTLVVKGR